MARSLPIRLGHSKRGMRVAGACDQMERDIILLLRPRQQARTRRPGWDACGNELDKFKPYDGTDDFARSIDACYEAVRERKAGGGKGWPADTLEEAERSKSDRMERLIDTYKDEQ